MWRLGRCGKGCARVAGVCQQVSPLPKPMQFRGLFAPAPAVLSALATIMVATLAIAALMVALLVRRKRARAYTRSWRDVDESILKVGGTQQRLSALDGQIDVLIVGSGMGALSCGSFLSKVGYRVALLEQHDVIGGALHSFKDSARREDVTFRFTFETGVHYLGGELDKPWGEVPWRRVFHSVSDGALEFTRTDEHRDRVINRVSGEEHTFVTDGDANTQALIDKFANEPGAVDAIRKFDSWVWPGFCGLYAFVAIKLSPRWALWLVYAAVKRLLVGSGTIRTDEVQEDARYC